MSHLLNQLKELVHLRDSGQITQEEFESRHRKILEKLPSNPESASTNENAKTSPSIQHVPAYPDANPLSGNTSIGDIEPSSPPLGLSGATQVGGSDLLSPASHQNVERIGNYQIIDKIGEGGMGVVYRAKHTVTEYAQSIGDVAIKIMHPQYAQDENFRRRFIQEATVGESLNHPAVANIRDIILEGGYLAIVMEFVQGKSLSEYIIPEGLHPTEVVTYLRPVAEAMDTIHSKGIIHRDLKPDNIKIRPDGSPVILDFGIAKDQQKSGGATKTGTTMGTVAYMAPEQMNAKNIGPYSDQYAIGMIAYEMLNGSLPWENNTTEYEVYAKKIVGDLMPLQDNPNINKAVSGVVMRSLHEKPEDRYPNCTAFIEALALAIPKSNIKLEKPPEINEATATEPTGEGKNTITRTQEPPSLEDVPRRNQDIIPVVDQDAPPPEVDAERIARVKSQMQTLSTILIIMSVLGLVGTCGGLVTILETLGSSRNGASSTVEACLMMSSVPLYAMHIYVATKLKELKHRTLGLISAVLLSVQGCSCFCLSLPVCIYMLIVLNRSEVQEVFDLEAKRQRK